MFSSSRLRALARLDNSTEALLADALDLVPAGDGMLWGGAARYHVNETGMQLEAMATHGESVERAVAAFAVATETPPPFMLNEQDHTSITASGSWTPALRRGARVVPYEDFVCTVFAVSARRFAIVGQATQRARPRVQRAAQCHVQLKQMLRTNFRVRDALAGSCILNHAEAVFRPDGSLVDCADPALRALPFRHALAEVVRARECAGGFAPMAELAALQRWHDLAAGRLMFLDYVDSDTRRFIVCLRVHEPLQSNLALAAGERVTLERMLMGQSNKLIASELGVSCASISERIQRALRKLGARSLSELSVVLRSRRSLVFSDWMLGGEGFVALGFREDFAASLGSLSKSELVVLQELLLDRSQREIAFARGVALRTVANQVGSIYRKLRVSGRRELMAKLAAQ